ncbi:transcription elongation factor GreA [Mycoplasmoides gallisepticum]|uniref:Transcription elongation factor GreA n=4 Tax=Mycoplasmoides gallisepticum TaxID=2096 RepID=GREA_MYCGA|nr:transcription elongation factor GreA [Mycoplasmoides gallisepticum]Q7NBS1.1 RecName: Full=Transcription elongation factor GreA; AltName: Full=Transcript cleavage factor GreA [Mycoplasmoides gallisepticum str. R(low)]AAP56542.1 Transcription elongation factor greA (Transcript cleavage factor greA) [Mycoplasmoides gallisepticum str. R(low)]ADC30378.1 Transcription elongation factor greA (Transcript cleavage factor greA) [Mycoplasmoides gallisepticum str. R(high)]ADC31141.1 Transcription elonga
MAKTKKHLLTQEGLKKLQAELRLLVDVKRADVIKLIQEAREQGDLSENADYDSAKATQSEIESRITEIQDILNHYEIIKEVDTKNKRVIVGAKVTIHDHSDECNYTYEIVGPIESDPAENKISHESPVAKAIMDKKEGESAEVIGIEHPYKVTIKKIVL